MTKKGVPVTIQDKLELQSAIEAVGRLLGSLHKMQLDHGSDCNDLTCTVAVRVFDQCDGNYRVFTVVSADWLCVTMNEPRRENEQFPEIVHQFVTGGPLCIVRAITGESVVRAINRYRDLEPANR